MIEFQVTMISIPNNLLDMFEKPHGKLIYEDIGAGFRQPMISGVLQMQK